MLLKAAYVKYGVQYKAYMASADGSAANVELVPEPAANLSPSAANLPPPTTPPATNLSPPTTPPAANLSPSMSPSLFVIGRNPHSIVAAVVAPVGKLTYGFIPFMALAHLGSDLAASYVERVNSAAKDCMPEGSTLLADLPLEMFTILRMNAEFIEYFETNHPHLFTGGHPFSRTVVPFEFSLSVC